MQITEAQKVKVGDVRDYVESIFTIKHKIPVHVRAQEAEDVDFYTKYATFCFHVERYLNITDQKREMSMDDFRKVTAHIGKKAVKQGINMVLDGKIRLSGEDSEKFQEMLIDDVKGELFNNPED